MKTITVNTLPKDIDEFVQLRNQYSNTPEGGAAIFLLALKIYSDDEALGKQCLVVAVDRSALSNGDDYKGYSISTGSMRFIKSQIMQNKKIPSSYIQGATPENDYAVSLPYVYTFNRIDVNGEYAKVFVKCYGADSDRPISLKKNNKGIWKATNWSSVIVGVKRKPIDDDI